MDLQLFIFRINICRNVPGIASINYNQNQSTQRFIDIVE